MKAFWVCLIAALACFGLGQGQPRVCDIHVLLQRPRQADLKPAVKAVEDQDASIQMGSTSVDTVSMKFKAHENRDKNGFGLLFTLAQQNGSFTVAMPSGEFSLDFAKNAKGVTVVHMVQPAQKPYELAALGSDWDRFIGWRVTVDAAVEPAVVAAP
jgi:hypothetical protein